MWSGTIRRLRGQPLSRPKPSPHPAPAELTAFFSALIRSETRLYNAIHNTLRNQHGIPASQFEFLQYLADHPHARIADLARTFAVSIGGTSKGIDRLQRSGWVQRQNNPADRRSSLLQLTAAGRTLVNDATWTLHARLLALLGGAGVVHDIPASTRTLQTLQGFLERQDVGTPVG